MSPLTRLCECHQRNCLTSVSGSSPATMAFAHVPSEGGNVDDPGDPGPEKFGDERDQVCNTLIKETAAVAFHKANADLAMRSAILARARVEQDELFVGDWCYYWKPQGHKLDPFRWRGPCLVVAVEVMPERTSTIYWIVHGSSLLRFTRSQLRHESVPERFERQGQPPHLEQLRMPMSTRLLKALKPARGPVRAVDVAEMGQDPFYYPGGMPSLTLRVNLWTLSMMTSPLRTRPPLTPLRPTRTTSTWSPQRRRRRFPSMPSQRLPQRGPLRDLQEPKCLLLRRSTAELLASGPTLALKGLMHQLSPPLQTLQLAMKMTMQVKRALNKLNIPRASSRDENNNQRFCLNPSIENGGCMQLLPELPVRFQNKETKFWIDHHLVAKEMDNLPPSSHAWKKCIWWR